MQVYNILQLFLMVLPVSHCLTISSAVFRRGNRKSELGARKLNSDVFIITKPAPGPAAQHLEVSINGGSPIAGLFIMENPWKSYWNGWFRGAPILPTSWVWCISKHPRNSMEQTLGIQHISRCDKNLPVTNGPSQHAVPTSHALTVWVRSSHLGLSTINHSTNCDSDFSFMSLEFLLFDQFNPLFCCLSPFSINHQSPIIYKSSIIH